MDERQISDLVSAETREAFHGLVRSLVAQITQAAARHPALDAPDAGPKPGDVDDEYERRRDVLRRVRGGLVAAALISEVTADCAAEDAATAVWLGASLADLGASTGSTRQAARKRWPDLGAIYRTRRWLTGHSDDLIFMARLVLDHADALRPVDGLQEDLDQAVEALRQALDSAVQDLGSGSVIRQSPAVRWQHLSQLVDSHLRDVADLATATTAAATTALDGARGVLAHYDSITADVSAGTA